ncbi:PHP domain-containing protein [Flexilinea flocculi]|uniref:Predicted metal-dependent phosphoesterase TrpH, contains PHP domain n=1 Tax=Flexilinea flocculi TaxID=1678840 RepID=A0A0S7BT07_9CHLR|nr:PHP domain-containing protein [Flexilinea flocculi]GAP40625.1 predicted metal-dependent phosphoesterase TrpH, contains PHP domain [Flexilinea flocculi]
MKNWIDLHMHSNISSDGSYSPDALMQMCVSAGLRFVAVTDHNSVRGVEEAKKIAARLDIECISGIEFDCQLHGINLHLLGYRVDEQSDSLKTIEHDVLQKEKNASLVLIEKIKALGFHLDEEALWRLAVEDVITGEMLAEVILQDPQNSQMDILTEYRTGGRRSENAFLNFYWDFCSQGKPAYVPIDYIDAEALISAIKSMGGIPVLAHPGANIGTDEAPLLELIDFGLEGIEVYSSYHRADTVSFYRQIAEKYHLLQTTGSDFHGKIKPSIHLGSICCPEPELIYASLKERF